MYTLKIDSLPCIRLYVPPCKHEKHVQTLDSRRRKDPTAAHARASYAVTGVEPVRQLQPTRSLAACGAGLSEEGGRGGGVVRLTNIDLSGGSRHSWTSLYRGGNVGVTAPLRSEGENENSGCSLYSAATEKSLQKVSRDSFSVPDTLCCLLHLISACNETTRLSFPVLLCFHNLRNQLEISK